jgi:hypothetical protein
MEPIRKINTVEKNNLELKKIHELQNKIMEQRRGIGLTKGLPDIRKRQFIKKGILGIIAGIGIAVFSKIAHAGGIKFYGESDNIIGSSKGVAKAWLSIAAAGTNESPSYNVNATTDTATGDRIINLTTALSGNRPAGGHGWTRGGGPTAGDGIIIPETMTGGNTWVVRVWDSGGKTDHAHYHVIFGDI